MGRSKLLLPYAGRAILEHAVDAALGAVATPETGVASAEAGVAVSETGVGRVVVVLGPEASAARKLLEAAWPGRVDLTVVVNPDYRSGLASSLKAGLRTALAASSGSPDTSSVLPQAVVFCLGDQPRVTAGTIGGLISAYLASPERPAAVVPVHAGRRGNPVLIDSRLFPELLELTGDVGARGVLERHPAEILTVLAGAEVLLDVDTPADYLSLDSAGSLPSGDGRP
jgi:molybdenum cofactor cytidylyltransferase